MTLAIDSGSKAHTTTGQVSSATVGLTTAGTDELIILIVAMEVSTGVGLAQPATTSVSGGSGLSWAMRSSYGTTDTAGTEQCLRTIETWWAWASAQQTSQTITVHFNNTTNTDCAVLDVFAVTGVPSGNAGAPFDTNSSLPAKFAQTINVDVAVQATGVTTDDGHPLVFGLAWNSNISNFLANAATHTLLTYAQFGNINNVSYESEYEVRTTALSSATWTLNSGSHRNWSGMVDAINSTGSIPSKRRLGATIT